MGKTTRGLAGSFGALIAAVGFAAPALAWSTPVWIRQFGTPASEYAEDAATDEDVNVYVVGVTEGSLFGRNQGSGDGWVAKFDATGHKLWTQQIGTDQYDRATGVATDADGNVYVVGGLDAGNVAKYDAAGHRIWEQRIDGYPSKVATDKDGNAFVGSVTFDGEYGVSLAKLDGLGRLLWTRELPLGGASDYVSGVAADEEGNIYLAGSTDTSEAGYSGPAWVYKFESDGDRLWTWEMSDGDRHRARGVATDKEGNAYVVGYSAPSPFVANQAAAYVSWLIKFDAGGDTLWRRQISEGDSANDVATDEQGNAYLAGALPSWFLGRLGRPVWPGRALALANAVRDGRLRLGSHRVARERPGCLHRRLYLGPFGRASSRRRGRVRRQVRRAQFAVGIAEGVFRRMHFAQQPAHYAALMRPTCSMRG